MCAEGNPFRCHRTILADALTIQGVQVIDISGGRSGKEHVLTPFAVVEDKLVSYLRGIRVRRSDQFSLISSRVLLGVRAKTYVRIRLAPEESITNPIIADSNPATTAVAGGLIRETDARKK